MAVFADPRTTLTNGEPRAAVVAPKARGRRSASPQFAVLCAQAAGSRKTDGQCDDAVAHAEVRVGRRQLWICAVADGAGSAQWGGEGARLAVKVALAALRKDPALPVDGGRILDGVRAQLRQAATQKFGGVRQLSTTLTLVVADAESTVIVSVGDGAVVYREAADQPWRVGVWPMNGEYANSTPFVTDDEIVFAQSELPAVQAIAVMTDGMTALTLDLAHRQPFAPFFDNVATEMAQRTVAELTPHLQALLRSPRVTDRTDDDVTLVFAVRNRRTGARSN